MAILALAANSHVIRYTRFQSRFNDIIIMATFLYRTLNIVRLLRSETNRQPASDRQTDCASIFSYLLFFCDGQENCYSIDRVEEAEIAAHPFGHRRIAAFPTKDLLTHIGRKRNGFQI